MRRVTIRLWVAQSPSEGSGLALATVPAMAAGMAMAGSRHVADAAPILNILQRIGAMAGTALITASYLQFAPTTGSLTAFHHAGWILTAGAVLLALCAFFGESFRFNNAGRIKV